MIHQVVIAGFGGQGVLTCGQILALAGTIEGKHVTWMPTYGPEQRGGTASCVVTLSDRPIGSPLAERLSGAMIFNGPSLAKYEPRLPDGSVLVVDSCIVRVHGGYERHFVYAVPADTLARKVGLARAGNIVMLGSYIAASGVVSVESAREAITRYLGPHKSHLVGVNGEALAVGWRFVQGLQAGPERSFSRAV